MKQPEAGKERNEEVEEAQMGTRDVEIEQMLIGIRKQIRLVRADISETEHDIPLTTRLWLAERNIAAAEDLVRGRNDVGTTRPPDK